MSPVSLLLLSLAFTGCSAFGGMGRFRNPMFGGMGKFGGQGQGFPGRFPGQGQGFPTGPATGRSTPSVCSGKGTLGQRFAVNIGINDADNDSFVSGPEMYNDFRNNYDTNKDGCVTLAEWEQRWVQGLLFSKAFADNRWAALQPSNNTACPVTYASFQNNTNMRMPLGGFISGNLQTLVDTCKSDNSLLISNCDCLQLLGACVNDATLSANSVCNTYVAQPVNATTTPVLG
ncbi:uncharacterized protein LOC101847681 isoform X2 [Aplysia californica]|uniref:Uncharacterized protein LOC101847681 isoform X1 n=1 Tax=Aplysia californica TaxID=6500 RepID=A0ABM1A8B3_APLCA|nr:uncharacterized protein LOC101847681 isoform X1 [Aplysia californica]XP_012942757.1 uncharacterized protein LOC101847681 isoform X2 [Aplysia californica]